MRETIMLIMEIIGTFSFAVSGALVAIERKLDLFGVCFLGCVTAVGGGIFRDVLMGKFPPNIFTNLKILGIAFVTSLIVFIIAFCNSKKFLLWKEKLEPINNIFDAIGLSAFSVTGTQIACSSEFSGNAFFAIFLGMLTGVGGGLLRDIIVSKPPYILTKHIYAIASILGSTAYYVLNLYIKNITLNTIIAMCLVIIVRLLSTKYKWSLPKINL